MSDWTIRRARMGDAPALEECFRAAYSEYACLPDLPPVAEGTADDIANHCVWIAGERRLVVGGLVLAIRPADAKVVNLAVRPEARGHGLGLKLLEVAEAHCREAGIDYIKLTTHTAMGGNIDLYTQLGWRETGRGRHRVHLAKRLKG